MGFLEQSLATWSLPQLIKQFLLFCYLHIQVAYNKQQQEKVKNTYTGIFKKLEG